MRRGHRLPVDPVSREVFQDQQSNIRADDELVKASRELEKNHIRFNDPE